jgi:3-keto-disaccharide hydrolase
MSPHRLSVAFVVTLAAAIGIAPAMYAEDKKPAKDEAGWKSLFDGKSLDGWKSAYPADSSGKVDVKDGAIVMAKGQKMTGVVYTKGNFPKVDYEVILEGKRIDGRDFFCTTTFPVGDSFCSLVVGGWGGTVTGLSSINGSDASENETTGSKEFKDNEWYKVRIRVTAKKIEAWIGDDQVADVERKQKKIETRIECDDCQPFGICTYDTIGAVRDIKVRTLTDAEKKAGGGKEPEKK